MARSKQRSTQNIWLISYADFMTILMIFFLCMYGYAALARANVVKAQGLKSVDQFGAILEGLKNNLGEQVDIQNQADKFVVKMSQEVLFKSGRAELSEQSKPTVQALANSLKQTLDPIIVEGHTDNVAIVNGQFASNWELSAARAFSLIEALKQYGVPEQQLSAWGFGEYRPLVSNDNELHRQKNRRIEVVILKSQAKT